MVTPVLVEESISVAVATLSKVALEAKVDEATLVRTAAEEEPEHQEDVGSLLRPTLEQTSTAISYQ